MSSLYISVMQNPFGFKSSYSRAYWLTWLIFAGLYATGLVLIFGFGIPRAIADAAIFAISFAVIGLVSWSVVNFSSLEKSRIVNTLITHLAASALLVMVATSFSQSILGLIFPDSGTFYEFNTQAHYIRILGGIGLYIFIALIYYLTIYYEEYQRKKQHEAEIENHLKVAELSMLKAQINPHFIFNSLNSISSLTLTNPEAAHEMVIHLADFLRYSVGKTGEELQTLASEVSAINLFLYIEKIRFGSRLNFEINCEEVNQDYKLPALILQPLIENAVKYGTHESTIDNTIKMSCEMQDKVLIISLSNKIEASGVPKKGSGIGIKNVKARLALLYGREDLLEAERMDDMYHVTLKIPQL